MRKWLGQLLIDLGVRLYPKDATILNITARNNFHHVYNKHGWGEVAPAIDENWGARNWTMAMDMGYPEKDFGMVTLYKNNAGAWEALSENRIEDKIYTDWVVPRCV